MFRPSQILLNLCTHVLKPWAIAAMALALVTALGALVATRHEPLPDFQAYEAGPDRKSVFFDFVQPLVEEANQSVLADRRRLEALAKQTEVGWLDRAWLERMARDYAVEDLSLGDDALIEELLRRADAVPVSLALAQAAKESGWGTSRFARDGNNLFGEWCYEAGCGIVPAARGDGRRHEVERFASAKASVESYVRNLNTHFSYEEFRLRRQQLRNSGLPLTGLALADAVARYSERRAPYVEEIKRLIRFNKLPERVLAGSAD